MRPNSAGLGKVERLTDAELWIVHALLRGLAYEEIAGLRAASTRTVANQVAAVYRKSGARSRSELAARRFPVPLEFARPECIALALPELTECERRVVYCAALGHTNKWIASELAMTPSTVASHLGDAIRKLKLRRRVELAGLLWERGHATNAGSDGADNGRARARCEGDPSGSPK